MLKLKLQYFGHLMRRANSLEKILILGKTRELFMEKKIATHSSVLAWRIPGTGGAWWADIYGVAQSQTRLK